MGRRREASGPFRVPSAPPGPSLPLGVTAARCASLGWLGWRLAPPENALPYRGLRLRALLGVLPGGFRSLRRHRRFWLVRVGRFRGFVQTFLGRDAVGVASQIRVIGLDAVVVAAGIEQRARRVERLLLED